jgi:hypothetical protein
LFLGFVSAKWCFMYFLFIKYMKRSSRLCF